MGSCPSCIECSRIVPKVIRFFNFFTLDSFGRRVYKYFTGYKWIKINDDEYLCPHCLRNRQEREAELYRKKMRRKENIRLKALRQEKEIEKGRWIEKRRQELRLQKEKQQEKLRCKEKQQQKEEKSLQEERRQDVQKKTEEAEEMNLRGGEEQQSKVTSPNLQINDEKMKQDEYRRKCERDLFSSIHHEKRTAHKVLNTPCDKKERYDEHLLLSKSSNNTFETNSELQEILNVFNQFEENCASVEHVKAMKKSLVNLGKKLHWDNDHLSKVVSNQYFRKNPEEAAHALHLLEIYAVKPNDIIRLPDCSIMGYIFSIFKTETSYYEMEVIDFLSDESSNIEKTIRKNFGHKNPRDIDSIVHEMRGFIREEDLLRMKRIMEKVHERQKKDLKEDERILMVPFVDHLLIQPLHLFEHEEVCTGYIYTVSKAVHRTQNFWPNHVQISALCSLIQTHPNGVLLEIKTGEGKSCIVAMFAALLCLSGLQRHVDIVSSSCVLASRDALAWKPFYQELGISVTHNITKNVQTARQECYSSNVVYGSVSSFASDILREEFLLEQTRSGRSFETVIVDEVDCLLLDNGVQFTYLSHAVPGLHHLEPVLLMIWNEVVRYTFIQSATSNVFAFGRIEPFHEIILSCIEISADDKQDQVTHLLHLFVMNGILRQDISRKILEEISEGPAKFSEQKSVFRQTFDTITMLKCLYLLSSFYDIEFEPFQIDATNKLVPVNNNAISERAVKILVGEYGCVSFLYDSKTKLIQLIEGKVLHYLESKEQNEKYDIPQNFMPFLKNRLNEWIKNAFLAKDMQLGREYLITEQNIVPIDFESTGVIEHGTKWSDCLHQFVEIKHSKQLSPISVVTNFLSNHAFFKRYGTRIFGLSGTLGIDDEKSFLRLAFDLDCLKIPTNERQKFYELPGILCKNTEEWISSIRTCLLSLKQEERPVLVICEDINKTEIVDKSLDGSSFPSKIVYNRNDVDNEEIQQSMKAGDLIIATNIAGRGTDLQIHADVNENGGLFVLVTFLPLNERVEKQIFGRTARNGQTGSAQIIIDRSSLRSELASIDNLSDLKRIRNKMNATRLADYHAELTQTVAKKERLFRSYCKYLKCNSISDEKSENKIYRNSMHEFWGFWLKTYFTPNANIEELEEKLLMDFTDALHKTKSNDSPNSNICHIIHIANEELENKNFVKAHSLFTKAIEQDKKWSAVAYYNRAFCSIRQWPSRLFWVVEDLKKARQCFEVFKEETLLCIALIQATQGASLDSKEPGSIMLQMQTRCLILGHLDENIKSALLKIEEIQKSKKQTDIEAISPFSLAIGDVSKKRIDDEMYLFWEMGLLEVISVHEKRPFSWKGLVVTVIGIVQISVGAIIIDLTSGTLSNLGWQLVREGINDIYTGIHAIIKRNSSFVKSWAIAKTAGIAISFSVFGFNAYKSKRALRVTFSRLKNEAKVALSNVKGIMKAKFKSTCQNVAVYTGKELSKRAGRYFIDLGKTKLKESFENRALNEVKHQVKKTFRKEFRCVARKFICHFLLQDAKPDDIRRIFLRDFEIMMSDVKTTQIGPLLCGYVKHALMAIKEDSKDENLKDYFHIFELFDSLKYEVCNISRLVQLCMTQLDKTINNIHGDNLNMITKEQETSHSSEIDDLVKKVQIDTAEKIFRVITDSFEQTGNTLISEKLADSLLGLVTAFSTGDRFSKNCKNNVLKATCNVAFLALPDNELGNYVKRVADFTIITTEKGLQAIRSGDSKQWISTTIDITENAVDTFCDGQKQKTLKFGLTSARQVTNAIQSEKKEQIISSIFDITENAIDTFADEERKKALKFGVTSARQATEAIQSGKKEQIISSGFDITENAVDTFADAKRKTTLAFGVTSARQATEAIQSGKKEQIISSGFDITENAIDTFADEERKKALKFGVTSARQATEAIQRGKKEQIISSGFDITENAVDIFADEERKKALKFGVTSARQATEAIQSGKKEQIISSGFDITENAIDTFADEERKKALKFGVTSARQATEAIQRGKKEQIISSGFDITENAVDIFADEERKKTLTFGMKSARQATEAFQSGKKEKVIFTVFDITENAVDTFADEKRKKALKFGVTSAKQATEAIQSGKKEQFMSSFFDITENAVDTFADDEIQKTVNLRLKSARQATNCIKSGEEEQIIVSSFDISENGVEKEKTKKFGLKSKNGKSSVRSCLKSEEKTNGFYRF